MTSIVDPVRPDAPGAREIGFDRSRHANGGDLLFDNLDKGNGDRRAITGPNGTLTYAELCADAARFGNALLSLGAARGDRIAMFLDDTPAYPAAFFGALRAGLVPVMLNTQTPSDLLNFYLTDSAARLAVLDASFAGTFDANAIRDTELAHAIVVNGDATTAAPETVLAESLTGALPTTLARADTGPEDMAFWMYSSGSTGRPKGIVHLHHDMAYVAQSYGRLVDLEPDDMCFSVPKIFFAYGMGNTFIFPFATGASSLLLPGRPTPSRVFEAIAEFAPTVLFALPTLYTALCRAPEAKTADLSSLRMCISAAEILSAEIFNSWRGLSGHEVVEGLGSTEMLHVYISNRSDRKKLGSAGLRVPGYEVRLCDADGREVSTGEEGVMQVRGDSSAPCYWNRPDKTAETMRGDWLYTGDRFTLDEDGFYFFQGRADDLIKVSGQWVYPLEVERCLAEHPAIDECAVLAHELGDRRMTLRAFVKLKSGVGDEATTGDLQQFVKDRLVPYKYPRIVDYLDELPKTGTGKIDRQALKAIE